MLVKATNEISTEAETTKTKDHKAQLEEVFDLKGALPSNKNSPNPLLAFAVDLCAFLCLYACLVQAALSSWAA
jgi:hypothetical protein